MSDRDPEGKRLPISIDSTSNGEFAPVPLDKRNRISNDLARSWVGENARKVGLARRAFLVSLTGAATTLLAINKVNAAARKTGGSYLIPTEAAFETDAALEALGGREFIFDVQGHYVNPQGAWLKTLVPGAKPFSFFAPANDCIRETGTENLDYLNCLGSEEFLKEVFLDSDTDMMVLSFVPSARDAEPLTIEEADQTRRIIDALEGGKRMMLHGRVNPNQPGDLEDMARLAADYPISAWKTYTQWGPDGVGFSMTDDQGEALIARAKALGVTNIAIHKGLSFGPAVLRAEPLLGHRRGRAAPPRDQLHHLPLRLRRRHDRAGLHPRPGPARRHRRALPVPDRRRGPTERQRLRRARAPPGASSCATPTRPPTPWENSSATAARTTCSGVPTPSGTAARKTRSRPSAPSRFLLSFRTSTAMPR